MRKESSKQDVLMLLARSKTDFAKWERRLEEVESQALHGDEDEQRGKESIHWKRKDTSDEEGEGETSSTILNDRHSTWAMKNDEGKSGMLKMIKKTWARMISMASLWSF